MKQQVITRIHIFETARFSAIVFSAISLITALISIIVANVQINQMSTLIHSSDIATPSFGQLRLWLLIINPLLGFVYGWLAGLAGAFIYNAVAKKMGGITITIKDIS